MSSGKRGILLLIAILALCAVLGGMYGPSVRATASGASDVQQAVKEFTQVLAVVEKNYAAPVDVDQAVYEGAIPGMLRTLDPHSNFFDKRQFSLLREEQRGRYYGVGMQVAPQSGQTIVVVPFVGSPAYKAGIRPGDIILKVDGKPCKGLTTPQVADLLKGPKGTVVNITIGREGWSKPLEITVTRAEIPRPGVDFWTMLKPGVGYIRMSAFNETTAQELAEALKKLDVARLDGLILDLRGNPGGLLNQAVDVADMFLQKGQLIVSHHGRASPERRYVAVHGSHGVDVPIVVLINGQTASASEIVAGALQDHDRALVVGETSFGKGLVQTVSQLSYGTGLALTTARYYTPSGRLIQRDYHKVSLYDYHYNPEPPKQPEVKLTDSGRQVFGEGGITPDVKVPEPQLDSFQQMLLERGVFFPFQAGVGDFTRWFLGQRPQITKQFTVDDAVMKEFRHYLTTQQIPYTDAELAKDGSWIKDRIKQEVFTSLFGMDEGFKVALQHDLQVQKAVDSIPEARALYQNARRIIAERTARQGSPAR
jgi:carboxyl-terminal processing protease